MRHYIAVTFAIIVLALPWFMVNDPVGTHNVFYSIDRMGEGFADVIGRAGLQLASVVMRKTKTVEDLQKKYTSVVKGKNKIRVLLVPGHEPNYGGAEYRDLKERDMNIELIEYLTQILRNNGAYEVITTRSRDSWSPEFSEYFKNKRQEIIDWQSAYKQERISLLALRGQKPPVASVYHNDAPQEVALRLYGITKWSNDNDVDIAIHVHFNDYPGHPRNTPGKYSGFAIYVPEQSYANSTTTRVIADTVFKRLAKYNPVSDFAGESAGIVNEPDLIAIGAYDTSDAPSMLMEYGYIYEPQFATSELRSLALKDMAYQTYLGLEDFFNQKGSTKIGLAYDTLVLPYIWKGRIDENNDKNPDVFALQTAMIYDGVYPPLDKNRNDCPRTGKIGPCTKISLESFQKKYGIVGESGVGNNTVKKLNELYSGVR